MFAFLSQMPMLRLVGQADFISQLVLFCLLALSVTCLSIIIWKYSALKQQAASFNRLLSRLRDVRSLDDLVQVKRVMAEGVGARYLDFFLQELYALAGVRNHAQEAFQPQPADVKVVNTDMLTERLDHMIDTVVDDMWRGINVLGVSASVSPLVGLLGTVWGLIHAFMSISQHRSADIAVVAPGIAEALLTTLAGLVVAIPALIFFQVLSGRVRAMERQLLHISDRLVGFVRMENKD
jgi:biopolymer transport protein TolQ